MNSSYLVLPQLTKSIDFFKFLNKTVLNHNQFITDMIYNFQQIELNPIIYIRNYKFTYQNKFSMRMEIHFRFTTSDEALKASKLWNVLSGTFTKDKNILIYLLDIDLHLIHTSCAQPFPTFRDVIIVFLDEKNNITDKFVYIYHN